MLRKIKDAWAGVLHQMSFSSMAAMPPRKVAVAVLAVVAAANTVVFAVYSLHSPLADLQTALDGFLEVTDFHRSAAALFARVQSDRERFWFTDSSLTHTQVQLDVSQVVAGDGGEPPELFYDPRWTLSAYMAALRRAGSTREPPTLAFHWADWLNLSMAHTQFGEKKSMQMTCSRLRNAVRYHPAVDAFCKNNADYTDEEIEAMGFRSRSQLPQAIVHHHCPHEHPSYNGVRVFMAKSYALTHLPKPLKVVMLNSLAHGGGTYEFAVDQRQGSAQRLVHSGLAEQLVAQQRGGLASALFGKAARVRVDHLQVFENLAANVRPHTLAADADEMAMHRTTQSPAGSAKELRLQESHFDYPRANIQKYIEHYEAKERRSAHEQNFLEGLRDCAQYDGTNEPTYFKMATLDIREHKNYLNDWGWHYDWRFFNDALFYHRAGWTKDERVARTTIILERLLRNWNRFAEEKGLVSWIMHGPLLSWYWGGSMFPYDVDIDIQMPISELVRLSRDYNQTLVLESPTEGFGKYLIDVGTYIHNRERSDTGNHIDARFVDVDSGIYIDITGLARSPFELPDEYKERPIVQKSAPDDQVYNDRRKHFYTLPQLSPLKYTMLGGVPTYIPNQIEQRLKWEYPAGLENYEFHDWYFVPKLQLWVSKSKLLDVFDASSYNNDRQKFDAGKMAACVRDMSDADALRLLHDDETLAEFYQTSRFTQWHLQEKRILFDAAGSDNLTALQDPHTKRRYDNLVGQVRFSKPWRKCLFEYEAFDRLQHRAPAPAAA